MRGIHFSWTLSLGDLIIAVVPLAFLLGNALTFYVYRHKTPRILSEADQKLIRNEQTKLSATWLNTMAGGLIAVGTIATVVATFSSFERGDPIDWTLLAGSCIWIPAGVVLHFSARLVLRGLRA